MVFMTSSKARASSFFDTLPSYYLELTIFKVDCQLHFPEAFNSSLASLLEKHGEQGPKLLLEESLGALVTLRICILEVSKHIQVYIMPTCLHAKPASHPQKDPAFFGSLTGASSTLDMKASLKTTTGTIQILPFRPVESFKPWIRRNNLHIFASIPCKS